MKKKKTTVFLLTLVLAMLILPHTVAYADTMLNAELVTNGDAESANISGWTDDTGQGRWNSSAVYSTWALPAAGSKYFYLYNPTMDAPMSGTMSQEITLSGTEGSGLFSGISAGNVSISFSISMFQGISADNEAKAILEEYAADGSLLKTSQVVNTTSSGTAMGSYQINTQINPGTRKFKVILSATLTKGGYAQFDKVSLKLADASSKSAPVFGSDFPSSAETDAGVAYTANFSISDPDAGDVNNLTFSPSSTNVNLVPAANITVSGSGGSRTLTIVPAGNLSGEADITVSASDGTKSAEKTFHLIVHKVISIDTNLVENGNGTGGLAGWSGNTVNVTTTAIGFKTNDPNSSMSQNIDISKFSLLIDGGETDFFMSAAFPDGYGKVTAQFYTDIACTNPVDAPVSVDNTTASKQQKIPANAKGVKITLSNTCSNYTNIAVGNISFKIVNNFPKISSIGAKTTDLSALTVPVYTYYTTANATLTASSSDQAIVPDGGIAVGGSGFNRNITFIPLKNGNVTITLTLNDGSKSTSASFDVTVHEPAKVVSVTSPTPGFYGVGGNLDFTVQFNYPVTGGNGSKLPLTIGGAPAVASYLSSTTGSITYRYTIGGSDSGTVTIGTAIDDAKSPIKDMEGYDAEIGLNAGTTGVTVVQAPQVTSTAVGGSVTYGTGITFTAALNCAEPLSGTVQFKANGINLGSPVAVSGNMASYETGETELDAGPVSITAEFIPNGSNIHLTSSAYAIAVNQKEISVDGFTADAKTYDGTTNVSLSGGALTGVLTGDDVSAVYPTAGTAVQKDVGTQSVTFASIALNGADKDNYILSAQPSVSVVIKRKDIEVAPEPATKTHGTPDPVLGYRITSGALIASESLTGSLIRVPGEDIGEYEIMQGTVTNESNPNYNIAFISGVKLTVTAVNAAIIPDTGSFDRKTANQADVQTSITWGDATGVTDIKAGGASIGAYNYSVSGNMLTIRKEYLATQSVGSLVLTVEFNRGNAAALTVSIQDTTLPPVSNLPVWPVVSTLTASGTTATGTILNWTAATDDKGVTGYRIYRNNSLLQTVAGTVHSCEVSGLFPSTAYTFRVQAGDADNNWTYGPTVTVRTDSSGGGSGGGSSIPVPDPKPKPAAQMLDSDGNICKTITIQLDNSTGTAAIGIDAASLTGALDKSKTDGKGVKTVEVNIPETDGAKAYEPVLPASFLMSGDATKAIEIKTGMAAVTVPGNMLATANEAGAKSVSLTIAAADKSKLDLAMQAQIGDRPVIELNLKIDGKQTPWNNDSAPVTVTVPYIPTAEELVNPGSIVIWYIDGNGRVIPVPNGRYDPAAGNVTFTTTHFSDYAVGYNKVSFRDVAASAWYSKAVGFIAARGITSGTVNGNYSPEAKLTRGQFLVMMMKAYSIKADVNPKDNFADAGNTYYTGYLAAAKSLGISEGIENNMFAPDKEITRQEMFTLLYNALKVIGRLPQGNSGKTLSGFSDAGQIASWAKEAMKLLVETGTIGGNSGKLSPTGTTTRAEMAQVLYNLLAK